MKYLVAILLPAEITANINAIRAKYKTPSWNITLEPHITLLPPGKALVPAHQTVAILQGAVRNLAGDFMGSFKAGAFQAFNIEIAGIDWFYNLSNTIFAKVILSEQLRQLKQKLDIAGQQFLDLERRGYQEQNLMTANRYLPHITLSNKLAASRANDVFSELTKGPPIHYRFLCDGFHLFYKYPQDQQWQIVEKILF